MKVKKRLLSFNITIFEQIDKIAKDGSNESLEQLRNAKNYIDKKIDLIANTSTSQTSNLVELYTLQAYSQVFVLLEYKL